MHSSRNDAGTQDSRSGIYMLEAAMPMTSGVMLVSGSDGGDGGDGMAVAAAMAKGGGDGRGRRSDGESVHEVREHAHIQGTRCESARHL